MARRSISEFQTGEAVDQVFLLLDKKLGTTRRGSYYLKLTLADKSGTIPAMVWDAQPKWNDQLKVEDYLKVKGVIEEFQGSLQFKVQNFQIVDPSDVETSDFIPTTDKDVAALLKELRAIAATVKSKHLRALLDAFLEDDAFCEKLKRAPAAVRFHHAYLGGLIEHTLSVVKMIDPILAGRELNRDLLVTGAILHDIGKVREFAYEKTLRYTDEGELVGHIMIGAMMIVERARAIEGFPEELLTMIVHIVLSHHGEYEWGSPKLPLMKEALALHYLDNLDAKLFAFEAAAEESGDEDWSSYNKTLERRIFKKDIPT